MPINDFRVQLATAYPGAQPVESKKGNTLRGRIETDEGSKLAFVKLLSVEDIAREALCAVLARILHLPMLQPYYVYVDPAILADARAGNPFNVAFGLEEDPLPALRVTNQLLEDELMLWPEALPVAAFDEWTFNRDRIPGNLLFAGNRHFWLIDHDEALPNYASPEANSSSPLLQILSRDKSQFELFNMRKSLRARIDEYRSVDWAEVLRFLVPEQLTGSVPIFNRYIWFLKKRIEYLDEIFSQNLGIRQQELDLDSAGDRFRKKET